MSRNHHPNLFRLVSVEGKFLDPVEGNLLNQLD